MSIEMKTNLPTQAITKLQDLIRVNIDSNRGLLEAADEVKNDRIEKLFREIAAERASFAHDLQEHVAFNGESPADEGSYAAMFHRTWMRLRAGLNNGDAHVVLSEAERGEDEIKQAYESALVDPACSVVHDVLQQQYTSVKAGHDRVRDLRDSFAKL